MPNNPLRNLIEAIAGNPEAMAKLDEQAVQLETEKLDGIIDALASDLMEPDAPKNRATQIMDIGHGLHNRLGSEELSLLLSISIFRFHDAKAGN